ncbi:MAG: hypothetical protein JWO58_2939 [Chitinophagaceae bacterium]|nr:hypothetical protein [Chitinophagaceae bacterium]
MRDNNPNHVITKDFFEQLFTQWYQPLCKTAFRYLSNEQAAEDIVQDVFVKIWVQRDRTIFHHSAKAYLYKAVINSCLNYLEKSKNKQELNEQQWLHLAPTDVSSERKMISAEYQQQITQAINALPPACREVFMLSRFEELSNKEIGQTLNISIKTVENQMTKALKILKEKLATLYKNMLVFLFSLLYFNS